MLGFPASARTAVPASSIKRGLAIFNSAVGRPSGSRLPATTRTYADLADDLPEGGTGAADQADSTQDTGAARPLFSPKEIRNLMPDMTEMGLHRGDHGRSVPFTDGRHADDQSYRCDVRRGRLIRRSQDIVRDGEWPIFILCIC